MVEKPPKTVSGSGLGTPDQEHFARREQIFQALKLLVAQELEKNPQFNLTQKVLDDIVRANAAMFPSGVNTGATVMNYWRVAGFTI